MSFSQNLADFETKNFKKMAFWQMGYQGKTAIYF